MRDDLSPSLIISPMQKCVLVTAITKKPFRVTPSADSYRPFMRREKLYNDELLAFDDYFLFCLTGCLVYIR